MPLCPLMNPGLLISHSKKEKLFLKKLKNPTPQNINAFKVYNKTYNKICWTAKKLFYDSKFTEFSSDMRKTWNTIRDIIGTKKRRKNVKRKRFVSSSFI